MRRFSESGIKLKRARRIDLVRDNDAFKRLLSAFCFSMIDLINVELFLMNIVALYNCIEEWSKVSFMDHGLTLNFNISQVCQNNF